MRALLQLNLDPQIPFVLLTLPKLLFDPLVFLLLPSRPFGLLPYPLIPLLATAALTLLSGAFFSLLPLTILLLDALKLLALTGLPVGLLLFSRRCGQPRAPGGSHQPTPNSCKPRHSRAG